MGAAASPCGGTSPASGTAACRGWPDGRLPGPGVQAGHGTWPKPRVGDGSGDVPRSARSPGPGLGVLPREARGRSARLSTPRTEPVSSEVAAAPGARLPRGSHLTGPGAPGLGAGPGSPRAADALCGRAPPRLGVPLRRGAFTHGSLPAPRGAAPGPGPFPFPFPFPCPCRAGHPAAGRGGREGRKAALRGPRRSQRERGRAPGRSVPGGGRPPGGLGGCSEPGGAAPRWGPPVAPLWGAPRHPAGWLRARGAAAGGVRAPGVLICSQHCGERTQVALSNACPRLGDGWLRPSRLRGLP